jgi:hypothetical protein
LVVSKLHVTNGNGAVTADDSSAGEDEASVSADKVTEANRSDEAEPAPRRG